MHSVPVLSAEEISSLRHGGAILRNCLKHVAAAVRAGISLKELDALAEEFILSHPGATPGFKGYRGYPATLCISVNEQCVHGIPSNYELQEGDVVSLDGGVLYDNLYTDACITVGVGTMDPEDQRLIDVSAQALKDAVKVVKAGCRVGDISAAVQHTVENAGFTVVSALTGHGVGRGLHQFPDVPNIGTAGTGPVLPAGSVIAIEPIICRGEEDIVQEDDGWTISMHDGSRASHMEHTIVVTEKGCEILA